MSPQNSAPSAATASTTRVAPPALRQATIRQHAPRRANIRASTARSNRAVAAQDHPQRTMMHDQDQIITSWVSRCVSRGHGLCTRDPSEFHTGPHLWLHDRIFPDTPDEMRWRYPLSVAELRSLPRSVLQRVNRAVEQYLAHPNRSAELAAQWALVDNYDEIRPLRFLTWNRVRDLLGLPQLVDPPPRF